MSFLKYYKNSLEGSIMPFVNNMSYDRFVENISDCQSSPKFFSVYGKIHDWKEFDRGIQINGMEINGFSVENVDSNGNYSFKYVELTTFSQHKPIEPYSNEDILRGVTMSDIIKIKRHILGIDELKTPWQMIAADVNNSTSITTLDIIEIRKVVLGLQKDFTNNSSWRFTNKDYQFQTRLPLKEDFDAKLNLRICSEEIYKADLVAIKIGDVDGDYFE